MTSNANVINPAVLKGKQGMLYVIDGEKYDIHFPLEWALSHKATVEEFSDTESGPKDCVNCKCYGSINGVFVAYCPNCADYLHDGLREGILHDGSQTARDAFHTLSYMKGVSMSEIGDTDTPDAPHEYGADCHDEHLQVDEEEEECNCEDVEVEYFDNDICYPDCRIEREMRWRRKLSMQI